MECVKAVKDWPHPESWKQLQQLLGFANFYHKFIHGYSSVAVPLHHLIFSLVSFSWSHEVERAFHKLKELFISAPILSLPDPLWQFIVEVDASDFGVGAVLSQHHPRDNRLHPCAFFSW